MYAYNKTIYVRDTIGSGHRCVAMNVILRGYRYGIRVSHGFSYSGIFPLNSRARDEGGESWWVPRTAASHRFRTRDRANIYRSYHRETPRIARAPEIIYINCFYTNVNTDFRVELIVDFARARVIIHKINRHMAGFSIFAVNVHSYTQSESQSPAGGRMTVMIIAIVVRSYIVLRILLSSADAPPVISALIIMPATR